MIRAMPPSRATPVPGEFAWGAAVAALATAVSHAMSARFELADLIMVYLLGVVVVSTRFSLYPSIFTAVISSLAFEFFFIPPKWSFAILDPKHLVTFGVMLFAAITTSGLTERARRHAEQAHRAEAEARTERLRSLLLSSVSHDLRTPLAAIMGAASTMLDDEATLAAPTRRDLTQMVFEEASRLHRLLTNLLYMTRLESSSVRLRKEWQPIEEVIGAALTRLEARLRDRQVITHLTDRVMSAPFDGVLIEQVLINLVENALRYTPVESPIEISAFETDRAVTIEVADRGPGIPAGQEEKIFEQFYRSEKSKSDGGVGLGLSISSAILRAHGGRIWVENRQGGGAAFRLELPREGAAPRLGEADRLPEVRGGETRAGES
jgi:two-component system, OmpR family, sensor histidine kinase KdpD